MPKRNVRRRETKNPGEYAAVEALGFARIDHGRDARKGFPEVIYAPGKTPEQIIAEVGGWITRECERISDKRQLRRIGVL